MRSAKSLPCCKRSNLVASGPFTSGTKSCFLANAAHSSLRPTCIDAATGRRQWKEGRYGYGQLLLASGHLVVLSGEGELILVRANPEKHEELARFQAIHGKTWNHPAIADGRLLVRNAVEMACFDIIAP